MNLDKTEGMWLGSMAGRTDGPVNIKWRTDFIRTLGIFFTMSNCDFLSLNWNFRIEKLAKRLEPWKFWVLSLKGSPSLLTLLHYLVCGILDLSPPASLGWKEDQSDHL